MFRGINTINLDAKGRMALPARYREQLLDSCSGHLVVTID
ncbi:MAG: cell division/cell wall cluster transcriptional repressor MraZ, partial [Pseudomonadales bacterium]